MSTAVKGGLIAGVAVVVGWILYAASQGGDTQKKKTVDLDPPNAGQSNLAQDITRDFTDDQKSSRDARQEVPASSGRPAAARNGRPPQTTNERQGASPSAAPVEPKPTPKLPSTSGGTDPAAKPTDEPVRISPPARRPSLPPLSPSSGSQPDSPTAVGPTPTATIAGEADGPPAGDDPSSSTNSGDVPLVPRGPTTDSTRPGTPEFIAPARRDAPVTRGNAPPATPVITGGRSHTIEPGDTLIDIAIRYYDDESLWTLIKQANPKLDERRLLVGQSIIIPPKEQGVTRTLGAPRPAATSSALTYVVESGDSLIRIARNVLKDAERWREIYELNRDKLKSPDQIRIGMVLKLPPTSTRPTP